jgi:hypothetical protein
MGGNLAALFAALAIALWRSRVGLAPPSGPTGDARDFDIRSQPVRNSRRCSHQTLLVVQWNHDTANHPDALPRQPCISAGGKGINTREGIDVGPFACAEAEINSTRLRRLAKSTSLSWRTVILRYTEIPPNIQRPALAADLRQEHDRSEGDDLEL